MLPSPGRSSVALSSGGSAPTASPAANRQRPNCANTSAFSGAACADGAGLRAMEPHPEEVPMQDLTSNTPSVKVR